MKTKADQRKLEAFFRACSEFLTDSPKDDAEKRRLLKELRAAEKFVDEFIQAKNEETRKLRDQARLMNGIKQANRLVRKVGRKEVPVPKMM
jgi:hypothetical protein